MLTCCLILIMIIYYILESNPKSSIKSKDYYKKKLDEISKCNSSDFDINDKELDLVDIIRKGQYQAMKDIEIEKQSKHFPFDR